MPRSHNCGQALGATLHVYLDVGTEGETALLLQSLHIIGLTMTVVRSCGDILSTVIKISKTALGDKHLEQTSHQFSASSYQTNPQACLPCRHLYRSFFFLILLTALRGAGEEEEEEKNYLAFVA